MLNCQNEQKDKTSSPSGETLALLGQDNHQIAWNVAPPGPPASCHTCQTSTSKLPRALEIVQSVTSGVLSIMVHAICQGLFPTSLCQRRPDEGVLPPLCMGSSQNPVLHLPSQRPSDGLFSPMEVRTDHLPMCTDPLVPVRRAWSCTSKATPSRGSLVQNIMAM
jgi:hypothetical protein